MRLINTLRCRLVAYHRRPAVGQVCHRPLSSKDDSARRKPVPRTSCTIRQWCLTIGLLFCTHGTILAGDWPTWRYDAARGNASPHELPDDMRLLWMRELPPPRPAWPSSQEKLQFDVTYQPIVTGKLMIVGSTVNDSITAYDTATGNQVWRFYTDAPVRFAPAAHNQRIYAGSDDGHLYCLKAATGELLWKINGGPTERRVIGNNRLVSTWPVRGGPVIVDETVYFTASIWPFMGVFIHAVDADTGETVWTNSETGSRWVTHPHGAPSFGSIVPQGYLAAIGDQLFVPGGRSLPGLFDRQTGEMLRFEFGGKSTGGSTVVAHRDFYVVRNAAFRMKDGVSLGTVPTQVVTDQLLIGDTTAHQLDGIHEVKSKDGKSSKPRLKPAKSWAVTSPDLSILMVAGGKAYAGNKDFVGSFDIEAARDATRQVPPTWTAEIEGKPACMVSGDDKLFVVTDDAQVYCFGTSSGPVARHTRPRQDDTVSGEPPHGYTVVAGIGSGEVVERALASNRFVVVLDRDAQQVAQLRQDLDARGLYGTHATVHVGDLPSFNLPPYLATEILIDESESTAVIDPESIRDTYDVLRPYGGSARFALTSEQHEELADRVAALELPNAKLTRTADVTTLTRVGALPDSAPWTHQYGDAASSGISNDALVKAPLGLLWFGGPSNDKVLPRHGHGPSPQVAGGRLVIEGADMLRCVDVYTGQVVWERDLPGLGTYYDTTRHFAGAGEIGSNYVTLADAVYVVYEDAILKIDAATGKTTQRIQLANSDDGSRPGWGFLACDDDLLIATSSPVAVTDPEKKTDKPAAAKKKPNVGSRRSLPSGLRSAKYSSASRQLVVMDRHSGEVLWTRTAEHNFRHNSIAVANGIIYCIDRFSVKKLAALRRLQGESTAAPRLLALDARSGKELWSTDEDVFGTFLNYSVEHDILLQAGSAYRDRASDEASQGMVAYRGRDGKVLWKDLSKKHGGPCLLLRDRIITNGAGGVELDLLSGEPTGWSYSRKYGCNTAIGSQHLLTFRSGAAGFCDLAGDSGTGNIGGFRSSCTANLIVADGVFNAPDYTRTCVCAYQNQTSLALIHMPAAENWTFSSLKSPPPDFAINLGAPGDRREPEGALWYDLPVVGGDSPKLPVEIAGAKLRTVRHHSSIIDANATLPWVASSCVTGIESIRHAVEPGDHRYTVRLHFSELEEAASGERVFNVAIQGKAVLTDFDIRDASEGSRREVVKEFTGVQADGQLEVTFTATHGEACISGIQVTRE